MLGGSYRVRVLQPIASISGSEMLILNDVVGKQPNEITLLTKGEMPSYQVSPISGDTLQLDFSEPILTEEDFPNGVENSFSYDFNSTVPYPIQIQVLEAKHFDHNIDGNNPKRVSLKVRGMTSLNYVSKVSESTCFNYLGSELPSSNNTFTATEIGTGTSFLAPQSSASPGFSPQRQMGLTSLRK